MGGRITSGVESKLLNSPCSQTAASSLRACNDAIM